MPVLLPLKMPIIGNAIFVITRSCVGIPHTSASQPFLRCSLKMVDIDPRGQLDHPRGLLTVTGSNGLAEWAGVNE